MSRILQDSAGEPLLDSLGSALQDTIASIVFGNPSLFVTGYWSRPSAIGSWTQHQHNGLWQHISVRGKLS